MKLPGSLHALLRPKVLLPLLLIGALFFVALNLADLGKVMGQVKQIRLVDMALALGLAAVYLLLKGMQLHLLLFNLGAHLDWRRFALAFSVGELAVTLPMGIFAQNWVLSEEKKMHFGRSSAATVVMLLMEIAVVLVVLAVVPIPGWGPLQPAAAALLCVLAVLMFGVLRFEPLAQRLAHKVHHAKLHQTLLGAIGLIGGLKSLSKPHVLGINLVITPLYLGALALAFLIVGHGVGLHKLDYLQATSIYAFSLAAILLAGGLFGQIGTVEVVGMSAAKAWGMGYTEGLALMLGFRLVWTGAIWLLNGPVALRYWRALEPEGKAGSSEDGEEAPH